MSTIFSCYFGFLCDAPVVCVRVSGADCSLLGMRDCDDPLLVSVFHPAAV